MCDVAILIACHIGKVLRFVFASTKGQLVDKVAKGKREK